MTNPRASRTRPTSTTPPPPYQAETYDNADLVEMMVAMKGLHEKALSVLSRHEPLAMKPGPTQADLVDTAWIIRETARDAEDLRKMLNRLEKTFVNVIGLRFLKQEDASSIKGVLATGSPDCRDVPRIPSKSKDPGAYIAALEELGVPRVLAATGAVEFHFKGLGDFAERLQREGKPIPKALLEAGEPYTEFSLRLTTVARSNPFV
jgi:hypothetical protein